MTTVRKYLPLEVSTDHPVAHERVVLDISQQEAALLSLLLGYTSHVGPGGELYAALSHALNVDTTAAARLAAKQHLGYANTRHKDVLAYLGQFPGE